MKLRDLREKYKSPLKVVALKYPAGKEKQFRDVARKAGATVGVNTITKKGKELELHVDDRVIKKLSKMGHNVVDRTKDYKVPKREEVEEKKLTPAELKKREEIAKAIKKDDPDMPMDKKMAIATATAKRVAERVKDGKLDPTSKMGKGKLTGQEVGQYYRQNPKAKQAARDPMVKKAIELALDTGGNMTYGEKEVEKLKRGLSRHPEVKKAFQHANESVNEELLNEITLARKDFDKIKKGDKITVHFDSSMKKGHKQTLVVKSKTRSNKYNVDIINMMDAGDSRNRTKFKFFSRGGKDATLAWGDMAVTLTKYVMEYGGPPISRKKYLRQMREAVSAAQQAAIAISKKEKGEKPKNECADEKDFKPHMMYDPKTGKGYKANTYADHMKMDKMGYTHEKPKVKEQKNCGCGETPCKTYGVKSVSESKTMDAMRDIVKTKGAKKVDGVMVDLFTASAVTQIYNKVNDANKAKMDKMKASQLANAAYKLMNRK